MTLIVHELVTEVFQTITPNKNEIIVAIRPYILKHGNPSGSVYLEIQNSTGDLIATSETLTIASLSDSDHYHGKIRFYINAYLKADVTYRIVLKGSGYTFNESSYVGWCNAWEHSSYSPDYTQEDFNAPLALEIWSRKP